MKFLQVDHLNLGTTPELVTPTCDEEVLSAETLTSPLNKSILEGQKAEAATPMTSSSIPVIQNKSASPKKPSNQGPKRKGFLATLRERLYLRRSAASKSAEAENSSSVPSQDLSSCKSEIIKDVKLSKGCALYTFVGYTSTVNRDSPKFSADTTCSS